MKVAIVWNHESRLLDCSFRFEQYVAGVRALGHRPVIVCHSGSELGFPEPAKALAPRDFENPEAWRTIGATAAIIVTWHRMSTVLGAIQAAGTRVIAISDTDGQVGIRVHPRSTFDRLWMYHQGAGGKFECTKYWLRKYIADGLGENQEYLDSTRNSDVLVLGSRKGKANFAKFLRHYGQQELESKLTFLPFAVGASFLECEVQQPKSDQIVAIGRWADPQKNARLLARTIERFLKLRSNTRILLLGSGGTECFRSLTAEQPRVEYLGEVDQARVARILASSRAIAFSSRWEGSPHAANEALAAGATIIGTPIPSLSSWSENGRFGSIARRATPRALCAAMISEMKAWDEGARDAEEIAMEWRHRLSPERLCRRLLGSS